MHILLFGKLSHCRRIRSLATVAQPGSFPVGRWWAAGLVLALLAGAVLRLVWVEDMEFKGDELWTFDFASRRWANMQPHGEAPACAREAVYLPRHDVFLTLGSGRQPMLWSWSPARNGWRHLAIPDPATGQNRALVYDPKRDVLLLVAGTGGSSGEAAVYALRFTGD